MEQLSPDRETSLKKNIEVKFMEVCFDVTLLRSIVMNGGNGNVEYVFSTFRNDFDSFFSMSSDNKKIDKELVVEINVWLNKINRGLTLGMVKNGINLFTRYKSELFKQDIIKY